VASQTGIADMSPRPAPPQAPSFPPPHLARLWPRTASQRIITLFDEVSPDIVKTVVATAGPCERACRAACRSLAQDGAHAHHPSILNFARRLCASHGITQAQP